MHIQQDVGKIRPPAPGEVVRERCAKRLAQAPAVEPVASLDSLVARFGPRARYEPMGRGQPTGEATIRQPVKVGSPATMPP